MDRRLLRLGLVVGYSVMILPGCETLHPLGLRGRNDPATTIAGAPGEPQGFEDETPSGGQGFFKPSRLRGALSSEGAEVERHLGIE